ncbi:hypothetical protein LCGC14_3091320, partial [marine sediment metagenome]
MTAEPTGPVFFERVGEDTPQGDGHGLTERLQRRT